MKRAVAMMLVCVMALGMTACGGTTDSQQGSENKTPEGNKGPVTLEVVTTYAGNDGNADNYRNAASKWEKDTGNNIIDMSATADEAFKTRVLNDFETGSEPDVLFFFAGSDADTFVKDGKVVSIDEIRKVYPDYATNMDEAKLPKSPVDGKAYAVPVNGYWEGMFYNKEILDAAGVEVPGADYTWEAFLADCEKIKAKGYVPVSVSLSKEPHYWWEFSIFNHTSPSSHLQVPESVDTDQGKAWVAGMEDVKTMYEKGYFGDRATTLTSPEAQQQFYDGKAAFFVDGSWRLGGIVASCQTDPDDPTTLDTAKLEKYGVTYVPGQGNRKATDIIAGVSSGYYITKKCWDDPAKREAAVDFIKKMTTDEVVSNFAQVSATALKNGLTLDKSKLNSLQVKAIEMLDGTTTLTAAVQDLFPGACRVSTFDEMPLIVTGKVSAEDAVKAGLDVYKTLD